MARNLVAVLGPETFVSIKPKHAAKVSARSDSAEGIAVWAVALLERP